ncbi:MAG: hypothetical protein BGO98_08840 [Myxococcales bacterium 68-20]|nr:MAG: hypothetical protein BGO98_08840 [Myxococcales bacterium 68-20]
MVLTPLGTMAGSKAQIGASSGPCWRRVTSSVAIARGSPRDVVGTSIARGRGLPSSRESAC